MICVRAVLPASVSMGYEVHPEENLKRSGFQGAGGFGDGGVDPGLAPDHARRR
jgi:hypothetical protein